MEPSIPIHTLVKIVDSEDITKEQILAFDLQKEVITVTPYIESQNLSAENYDRILEVTFTQTTDPN